jgi:hypothetical protein
MYGQHIKARSCNLMAIIVAFVDGRCCRNERNVTKLLKESPSVTTGRRCCTRRRSTVRRHVGCGSSTRTWPWAHPASSPGPRSGGMQLAGAHGDAWCSGRRRSTSPSSSTRAGTTPAFRQGISTGSRPQLGWAKINWAHLLFSKLSSYFLLRIIFSVRKM